MIIKISYFWFSRVSLHRTICQYPGVTRKAKPLKLQLQTSFSDPETTVLSVLSKRTKNKVALLDNGSGFRDRGHWETISPEELGLLSSLSGSKETKRSWHTRIELWIPGKIGDIDLEFSDPKSMMFRTRLGSQNFACQKKDIIQRRHRNMLIG